MHQRVFGPDSVATPLTRLAEVMKALGRTEEADHLPRQISHGQDHARATVERQADGRPRQVRLLNAGVNNLKDIGRRDAHAVVRRDQESRRHNLPIQVQCGGRQRLAVGVHRRAGPRHGQIGARDGADAEEAGVGKQVLGPL